MEQTSHTDLKRLVVAEAQAAGFAAACVAAPAAIGPEAAARLARFLCEGRHGDMAWMAGTAERRGHPLALWSQARSVVMLGMSYAPEGDPLAGFQRLRKPNEQRPAPDHDDQEQDQQHHHGWV